VLLEEAVQIIDEEAGLRTEKQTIQDSGCR
jgi:hypothetical protein